MTKVTIKVPSGAIEDQMISVPTNIKILNFKQLLAIQHPCRPLPREQRLVCRGSLLKDEQTIEELIAEDDGDVVVLHLVIANGDYSDKRKPLTRAESDAENMLPLKAETPFKKVDSPVDNVPIVDNMSPIENVPVVDNVSPAETVPMVESVPDPLDLAESTAVPSANNLQEPPLQPTEQAAPLQHAVLEQPTIQTAPQPTNTAQPAPQPTAVPQAAAQPVATPHLYEYGGLRYDVSNLLIWDGRGFYKVKGVPLANLMVQPASALQPDQQQQQQQPQQQQQQQRQRRAAPIVDEDDDHEMVRVFQIHIDLSLVLNLVARILLIYLIFGKRMARWKLVSLCLGSCLVYLVQRGTIRPPARLVEWFRGQIARFAPAPQPDANADAVAAPRGGRLQMVFDVFAVIRNFVASLFPNHQVPPVVPDNPPPAVGDNPAPVVDNPVAPVAALPEEEVAAAADDDDANAPLLVEPVN